MLSKKIHLNTLPVKLAVIGAVTLAGLLFVINLRKIYNLQKIQDEFATKNLLMLMASHQRGMDLRIKGFDTINEPRKLGGKSGTKNGQRSARGRSASSGRDSDPDSRAPMSARTRSSTKQPAAGLLGRPAQRVRAPLSDMNQNRKSKAVEGKTITKAPPRPATRAFKPAGNTAESKQKEMARSRPMSTARKTDKSPNPVRGRLQPSPTRARQSPNRAARKPAVPRTSSQPSPGRTSRPQPSSARTVVSRPSPVRSARTQPGSAPSAAARQSPTRVARAQDSPMPARPNASNNSKQISNAPPAHLSPPPKVATSNSSAAPAAPAPAAPAAPAAAQQPAGQSWSLDKFEIGKALGKGKFG